MTKLEDLRIKQIRPLISPAVLQEEIPVTTKGQEVVRRTRLSLGEILERRDDRLIVIAGPCSIHDPEAAMDYARRLLQVAEQYKDKLVVVMRVYYEKPRTVVGWKGLINDPGLDESFQINKGLRMARQLLVNINDLGLPCGTEFLDTTFGQYYADLVSWGSIGARTAESQVHRELASGLSMPVGIKNRTDGDVQVAVDAINAATHKHLFSSLTKEGMPAIYETTGNEHAHLILRGGSVTGPNYDSVSLESAAARLRETGLPSKLIVDCSHANSDKNPEKQIEIVKDVVRQINAGSKSIAGLMIESNINGGRQDYLNKEEMKYGVSITDSCLSFEETAPLFEILASCQVRTLSLEAHSES